MIDQHFPKIKKKSFYSINDLPTTFRKIPWSNIFYRRWEIDCSISYWPIPTALKFKVCISHMSLTSIIKTLAQPNKICSDIGIKRSLQCIHTSIAKDMYSKFKVFYRHFVPKFIRFYFFRRIRNVWSGRLCFIHLG